jgi:senataxin
MVKVVLERKRTTLRARRRLSLLDTLARWRPPRSPATMNHASTSSRPQPPPPSPSTSYIAPTQVVYDLSLAQDASTASDSSWQDATESSLEWLLSLQPRSTTSAKGKEREEDTVVHWYCGAQGAQQCWESAIFLIRLLSFKKQGEVGQWRDRFDRWVLRLEEVRGKS